MKAKHPNPIYAIGGITLEHVESLMKTGIHGIAVSGLITQTENASQLIKQLTTNYMLPFKIGDKTLNPACFGYRKIWFNQQMEEAI
jgi:hypothetical protein